MFLFCPCWTGKQLAPVSPGLSDDTAAILISESLYNEEHFVMAFSFGAPKTSFSSFGTSTTTSAFSFGTPSTSTTGTTSLFGAKPATSTSAFSFGAGLGSTSAFGAKTTGTSAFGMYYNSSVSISLFDNDIVKMIYEIVHFLPCQSILQFTQESRSPC